MNNTSEDGYTLLETLVSFTILAGGLALALSASTLGLRSLSSASQSNRMMAQAEMALEQIAARATLTVTTERGSNDLYAWRSTIAALPEQSPSFLIKPFRVSIEVNEVKVQNSRISKVTTILLRKSSSP